MKDFEDFGRWLDEEVQRVRKVIEKRCQTDGREEVHFGVEDRVGEIVADGGE